MHHFQNENVARNDPNPGGHGGLNARGRRGGGRLGVNGVVGDHIQADAGAENAQVIQQANEVLDDNILDTILYCPYLYSTFSSNRTEEDVVELEVVEEEVDYVEELQ